MSDETREGAGGETSSDGEKDKREEGKGGLLEAFLSTYDRRRTREAYGHDLRGFFGKEEVTEAEVRAPTETEVQEYLWEVAGRKGPSAARRRAVALRTFYRWAWEKRGVLPEERAKALRKAARLKAGKLGN